MIVLRLMFLDIPILEAFANGMKMLRRRAFCKVGGLEFVRGEAWYDYEV
jgi:hypothetical protein